jgi:hypothetical protein
MVFESQLELCWPAEKVKTAARVEREKKMRQGGQSQVLTLLISAMVKPIGYMRPGSHVEILCNPF